MHSIQLNKGDEHNLNDCIQVIRDWTTECCSEILNFSDFKHVRNDFGWAFSVLWNRDSLSFLKWYTIVRCVHIYLVSIPLTHSNAQQFSYTRFDFQANLSHTFEFFIVPFDFNCAFQQFPMQFSFSFFVNEFNCIGWTYFQIFFYR